MSLAKEYKSNLSFAQAAACIHRAFDGQESIYVGRLDTTTKCRSIMAMFAPLTVSAVAHTYGFPSHLSLSNGHQSNASVLLTFIYITGEPPQYGINGSGSKLAIKENKQQRHAYTAPTVSGLKTAMQDRLLVCLLSTVVVSKRHTHVDTFQPIKRKTYTYCDLCKA